MTVTDIIEELGIPTAPDGHHHTTHGRVQIDCPYCSPRSEKWRLGIKTEYWTGWCNCWTCGSKRLADTLAETAGVSVPSVLAMAGRCNKDFAPQRTLGAGKLVLPALRGGLAGPHLRFLKYRGFDPKELKRLWKIEGIGIHPALAWRIFIPIHLDGQAVSWTTRSSNEIAKPPYRSAKPEQEKYPHKSLLYGEDYCTSTIVVVEGPLDVWALGPGATCTFGTSYTPEQMLRISKYPRRIICFDSEPDAQRMADRLCSELSVFDGETLNVTFETGKDASRASQKEISKFRRRFLPSAAR